MIPIQGSSWVSGVDYDAEHNVLTVETHGKRASDEFAHRETYLYIQVPPVVFQGIQNVIRSEGSVGNYINANVKRFFNRISETEYRMMREGQSRDMHNNEVMTATGR